MAEPGEKSAAKPKTVLFVDDDPQLVEEMTAALAAGGFKVKAAYTREEGLALIEKTRPDLVLLDLILPKLGGFAVMEGMKINRATADTPVVILTNLEQSEMVDRALRLGVKAYLVKAQTTPRDIIAVIRRALGTA